MRWWLYPVPDISCYPSVIYSNTEAYRSTPTALCGSNIDRQIPRTERSRRKCTASATRGPRPGIHGTPRSRGFPAGFFRSQLSSCSVHGFREAGSHRGLLDVRPMPAYYDSPITEEHCSLLPDIGYFPEPRLLARLFSFTYESEVVPIWKIMTASSPLLTFKE